MNKINKMNVNGEIYDIQDKSSGYLLPKDIENLASIDLVNEKFQEAIAMGFKVEVVEALPTENISHQIIYLVLNGDTEEQNIYDEYVYNSNNEWEKIGSTKTDLSNYYTKEEVENITSNLKFVPYFERPSGIDYSGVTKYTDETNLRIFSDYITRAYQLSGFKVPVATTSGFFEPTSNYGQSNIRSVKIFTFYNIRGYALGTSTYGKDDYQLTITGSWSDDDVFTAEYYQFHIGGSYKRKQFLSVSNTTAYEPTKGSYNPATALYVDNAINEALGNVNEVLETLTTIEEVSE